MINDGGPSNSGKASGDGSTKTCSTAQVEWAADPCPQPTHLRESIARCQAVVVPTGERSAHPFSSYKATKHSSRRKTSCRCELTSHLRIHWVGDIQLSQSAREC
jgi:hypothetical protein